MLSPIMTPSHTAVMLADGSVSRIGATMGTTTTAISMKSRKKPRMKITAITMMNWVQNPPGSPVRKSRTSSSPPNARNAAVNIAAPRRMMNTSDDVLAVSIITDASVLSILRVRHPAQPSDTRNAMVAMTATINATTSLVPWMFFTLMGETLTMVTSTAMETSARIAGRAAPGLSPCSRTPAMIVAPTAPMAPAWLTVAMPMMMEPSTTKMSVSGGTRIMSTRSPNLKSYLPS